MSKKRTILCLVLAIILVGSLVFAANVKIVDKESEDGKLAEFRVEDEYGAELGEASHASGGWNCFCSQSNKANDQYIADKQDAINWILNNCPKP